MDKNHVKPEDVKKIVLTGVDGKQYDAELTDSGLKIVGEIDPDSRPMSEIFVEPEPQEQPPDLEDQDEQEGGGSEAEDNTTEPMDEPANGAGAGAPPSPPKQIDYTPISDAAFKSRLMSIMRDNKYDRRVKGRNRGKLDMARLPKVPTGATNVFTQKQAKKNKEYNIVLVVDTSGSMDGRKARIAAEATTMLTKILQEAGIGVGVVTFDPITRVKEINKVFRKGDFSDMYGLIESSPGGTPMYQGMLAGYDMLRGVSGHKMMIVMADGEPNADWFSVYPLYAMGPDGDWVDPSRRFKNTVGLGIHIINDPKYVDRANPHYSPYSKLIEMNKDVETFGIGIIDEGMPLFVKDSVVINKVEQLKPVIIHQIKKKVQRG